jgi:hypothetical protein
MLRPGEGGDGGDAPSRRVRSVGRGELAALLASQDAFNDEGATQPTLGLPLPDINGRVPSIRLALQRFNRTAALYEVQNTRSRTSRRPRGGEAGQAPEEEGRPAQRQRRGGNRLLGTQREAGTGQRRVAIDEDEEDDGAPSETY